MVSPVPLTRSGRGARMRLVPRFGISLRRVALFAGLLACALAATACGDDETSDPGASGAALAGTQWLLDVDAIGVSDAGSVSSWVSFERARVSGNDGCNGFSGSYEADGAALTFGALASTQMACIGPADAVSRKVSPALGKVRAYEVSSEKLRLQDAGGQTLLTYSASTPGVEGSWTVTSVLYDDAIRGVAADTDLTAEFAADGALSGSTGCNSFRGSYTLDGKRIEIGPLAATKKACRTQEASEQEAGYLAALESAVKIDQAGPSLTLLNAKGQMAVTLQRAQLGG